MGAGGWLARGTVPGRMVWTVNIAGIGDSWGLMGSWGWVGGWVGGWWGLFG